MVRVVAVFAALGVLVTGQLAFGGTDQAGTWTVLVGEQSKPPAGSPKGTTLNQLFPGKLQVNAGDKVTFKSFGFHTVTYTAGKRPQALVMPDPQKTAYEGILDSAGEPFYFETLPKFVWNVAAFAPSGRRRSLAASPPARVLSSPRASRSP